MPTVPGTDALRSAQELENGARHQRFHRHPCWRYRSSHRRRSEGSFALEKLRNEAHRCALSPNMSRVIRSQPAAGRANEQHARQTLFSPFPDKPFAIEQVAARIRSMIEAGRERARHS